MMAMIAGQLAIYSGVKVLSSEGAIVSRSVKNKRTSGFRFFIKVYGSQRLGNRPKFSHTFAIFLKQGQSGGADSRSIQSISWLPSDGVINPLGPPEAGRNYCLDETFAWLDKAGSTTRWESPETEIEERLFESAMDRIQELNRGNLQYVMIDSMLSRPNKASNCIHAVSDLALSLAQLGMPFTGTLHGIEASRFVYHYFSPFYLGSASLPPEQETFFDTLQRDHVHRAIVQSSLVSTVRQLAEHSEHDE